MVSHQLIRDFIVRCRSLRLDLFANLHREVPQTLSAFLRLASLGVVENVEVNICALHRALLTDYVTAVRDRY